MSINFSIPIRGTDYAVVVRKQISENGGSSFIVNIPGFCDDPAGKTFSYDQSQQKLICNYSTHPELEAAVILTLTDYCVKNKIDLY